MNRKNLFEVLEQKIRIAWVEVMLDPECGEGLRVWFEKGGAIEVYRTKETFLKWLEAWDLTSTAAAAALAKGVTGKCHLLPLYRSHTTTFIQLKTKSCGFGEKYAYSWVNLGLIN